MFIKQTRSRFKIKQPLKGKRTLKIILGIFIFITCSGFLSLYLSLDYNPSGTKKLVKKVKSKISPFISAGEYHFKGMFVKGDEVRMHINHKNYQKLAYQKEMTNHPDAPEREMVKAKINYKDKEYPVRLRLKGDREVHIEHEYQWSFRVKVKGNNTVMGMREFSLQKPRMRNYLYEWLFHKVLKGEGFVALRYIFINLFVNGKNFGTYAIEEHFDKRLIEHNGNREGPILKFNESYNSDIIKGPFEPYNKKNWTHPDKAKLVQNALGLLDSFRANKIKVSEAFDADKIATFIALSDLLGMHHALIQKSVRLYYNPVTAKLEPIGFDGHFGTSRHGKFLAAEFGYEPESEWLYNLYRDWFNLFFKTDENFDFDFYHKYLQALKRVSRPQYLDSLFKSIDSELEYNLSLIHKDFPLLKDRIFYFGPDVFEFDKDEFYSNQNYIRSILLDKSPLLCHFQRSNQNTIDLKIGSLHRLPLEILRLNFQDSIYFENITRNILTPKPRKSTTYFENYTFEIPDDFIWADSLVQQLTLESKIITLNSIQKTGVQSWGVRSEKPLPVPSQKPNAKEFDFITFNESTKDITLTPGVLTISRTIIFPRGYTVHARGGTQINMTQNAVFISYSPLSFKGTDDNPIVFYSSDSTGQGIVVLGEGESLTWEYVNVKGLKNPNQMNWTIPGMISFYKTSADILHCTISGSRSEDALNLIQSSFKISNSIFENSFSDCLDGDFVTGEILNSTFKECGNDAIDVSGSKVSVIQVMVDGSGDKGLSAGENSTLSGENITILNTEIGVASKDKSMVELNNLVIKDNTIGITAYQKKSEFGVADIVVANLKLQDTRIPYLIEEGSSLSVGGKNINPSKKNVKDILYGVEFGKSSK